MREALLLLLPLGLALAPHAVQATDGPSRAEAHASKRARPAQVWNLLAPEDSTGVQSEEQVRARVENLLRRGAREEAVALLERRRESRGLEPGLVRHLARLYQDLERFEDLERLMAERVAEQGDAPEMADLRLLAEAYLAQDRPGEARRALQRILDQDPTDPTAMRLVANVLRHHGRIDDAIEVLVEGRGRLGDPYEFAQHLGTLYAEVGRWGEATREFLRVIVMSPLNVGLMRAQILEMADEPAALESVHEVAEEVFAQHPHVHQVALVLAELRQRSGDPGGAWELLRPLMGDPELLQEIIQMAMAGLADSRLPGADPERSLSTLRLSARVLQGLLYDQGLPQSLEPRAYDTLNRTLLAILENEHFATLPPAEHLEVLEEARKTIVEMGDRFPNSRLTAAALLRLGAIYVDTLHRPEDAIELYQLLQMSPNAPREQVHLARVGLGRAYIASGDTVSGRALFTAMGKDPGFRNGQGRAHYYLGTLDFMAGEFKTAQDRLASVALDAPTAEYTNDALDLALILAEQNLSPDPDVPALRNYGRALYFRATFEPDSLMAELTRVSESRPSTLRDRARLDMARLLIEGGDDTAALIQLSAIAEQSPGGRYTAPALDLKGEVLLRQGDEAGARVAFETILVEHEDYVFADGVRDKMRTLHSDEDEDQGDLP